MNKSPIVQPGRRGVGPRVARGAGRILAIYVPTAVIAVAAVWFSDWNGARVSCGEPYNVNLDKQITYAVSPPPSPANCVTPEQAAMSARIDTGIARMRSRMSPDEAARAKESDERFKQAQQDLGQEPEKPRPLCPAPPPPDRWITRDKAAAERCKQGVPPLSPRTSRAAAIAVGGPLGALLALSAGLILFRTGRWVWRGFGSQ